jgi:GAF domain-containing protein
MTDGMNPVSIDKLLKDLLNLADLVIYGCEPAGDKRITVSEAVVDYFQSDDFMVVGQLARGEAIAETQAELTRQVREQDTTIRELRNRIVQLEEVQAANKDLHEINTKLLERIKDLRIGAGLPA